MQQSSWGPRRRRREYPRTTLCLSLAALALTACATARADARPLSPSARAWRESFHENFAVDLSNTEANCVDREVGDLSRMVGPLLGQRPDDTHTSIWLAVDRCLTPPTQGRLARAIVHGGWSADEPSLAGVWDSADETLAACIDDRGGWASVGTYAALMANCVGDRTAEVAT